MNTRRFLVFLACLLIGFLGIGTPPAVADEAGSPAKLRVLFIGNSLTSVNDLPAVLSAMAAAKGKELVVGRELVGGATLKKHWDDGKALAKIKEGPWDYVVLQDLSKQAYSAREDMDKYVGLFVAEIQKAGAKPAFYMTWNLEDQPETFAKIEEAYTSLAKQHQGLLIPAGAAWHTLTSAAGGTPVPLYQKDHKHPLPAGTYLAACVFYRSLFHAPSTGLPNELQVKNKLLVRLSPADATTLQKAADGVPLASN